MTVLEMSPFPSHSDADLEHLAKDEMFFYTPHVTIVAEQTAFKVPLKGLWQSDFIAKELKELGLPDATTPLSECNSLSAAVHLDNVTADELRGFLKLLIQTPLGCTDNADSTTEQELISALKLAHRWQFSAVHTDAIARLEKHDLPSARKLELSQLYEVPKWYGVELGRFALRADSLTLEEAERLGLKHTVLVASLREASSSRNLSLSMMSKGNGGSQPRAGSAGLLEEALVSRGEMSTCQRLLEHLRSLGDSDSARTLGQDVIEGWAKSYKEKMEKALNELDSGSFPFAPKSSEFVDKQSANKATNTLTFSQAAAAASSGAVSASAPTAFTMPFFPTSSPAAPPHTGQPPAPSVFFGQTGGANAAPALNSFGSAQHASNGRSSIFASQVGRPFGAPTAGSINAPAAAGHSLPSSFPHSSSTSMATFGSDSVFGNKSGNSKLYNPLILS